MAFFKTKRPIKNKKMLVVERVSCLAREWKSLPSFLLAVIV
jgi:hypothetical protein